MARGFSVVAEGLGGEGRWGRLASSPLGSELNHLTQCPRSRRGGQADTPAQLSDGLTYDNSSAICW